KDTRNSIQNKNKTSNKKNSNRMALLQKILEKLDILEEKQTQNKHHTISSKEKEAYSEKEDITKPNETKNTILPKENRQIQNTQNSTKQDDIANTYQLQE
ncbi:14451_t:CDS:2, partial [Dentiscutata heterogama]